MLRPFFIGLLCTMAVVSLPAQSPPQENVPTILVSRQLLEAQGLSVGEIVSLSPEPSGDHPRRFRIAAAYEPTPDPMRLGAVRHEVRLHLPDLLEMSADPRDPLSLESVDALNIVLESPDTAGSFARLLSARVPGIF